MEKREDRLALPAQVRCQTAAGWMRGACVEQLVERRLHLSNGNDQPVRANLCAIPSVAYPDGPLQELLECRQPEQRRAVGRELEQTFDATQNVRQASLTSRLQKCASSPVSDPTIPHDRSAVVRSDQIFRFFSAPTPSDHKVRLLSGGRHM